VLLLEEVTNAHRSERLDAALEEVQQRLRQRFAGADRAALQARMCRTTARSARPITSCASWSPWQ
jgi:hypothetical protein